jgi:hypothetical protein
VKRKPSSEQRMVARLRTLPLLHVEPVYKMREGRLIKDLWLVQEHGKYGDRDCATLGGACAVDVVLRDEEVPLLCARSKG